MSTGRDGCRPFTHDRVWSVFIAACRIGGLDVSDAARLRFGENAIYYLPRERKVVRVGRSIDAADKEVHVASWLAGHNFPAATVGNDFASGPIVVDNLPVTVWDYIDEIGPPISAAEFGGVLRDLHSLPAPTDFQLPPFSPMPKVEGRLDRLRSTGFPAPELQFLRSLATRLSAEFASLVFALPSGPIHGDAHPGNLMRARGGAILLIDFEDFSVGPREWDAAVLSIRHQAFGWESEKEYQSYVKAYGADPIDWPGFPILRGIRELNMTTWLAQRFGESAEVTNEVLKRVADLRDDQAARDWRAF